MNKIEQYRDKIRKATEEWFTLYDYNSINLDGDFTLKELREICNVLEEMKRNERY